MLEIIIDILWKGLFFLVVIGIAQAILLIWIATAMIDIWSWIQDYKMRR